MKKIVFLAIFNLLAFNIYAQNNMKEKNIQPIVNGVEVVSKLDPIQFQHDAPTIALNQQNGTQYGIDVSKLKKVLPHAVKRSFFTISQGKSTPKQDSVDIVDYNALIPFLIAAIQEQQKEIEILKEKLK